MFTTLRADLYTPDILHLACAFMEHFLDGSALLTLKRRLVIVTLLIWVNVPIIRVQGSKLREGVTFGPQRGERGVQGKIAGGPLILSFYFIFM